MCRFLGTSPLNGEHDFQTPDKVSVRGLKHKNRWVTILICFQDSSTNLLLLCLFKIICFTYLRSRLFSVIRRYTKGLVVFRFLIWFFPQNLVFFQSTDLPVHSPQTRHILTLKRTKSFVEKPNMILPGDACESFQIMYIF